MKAYIDLISASLLFIALAALADNHSHWWALAGAVSATWLCLSRYLASASRDWALSQVGLETRGDEVFIRDTGEKITFYDVHAIQKTRIISRDARSARS